LPETALRATSRRLATRSSAAPLTCAVVWSREVMQGGVNPRRIDGKDGVAWSIPVNGSIRNTAEAYFDATSATYTRAWTAVTTRVGQYRATRHERPTPTSSLYMSDTDKSYISSKRILHQLHRRLARTSPNPHQASTAALAITGEASPFALRSTRNHTRTAMHRRCCPSCPVDDDAERSCQQSASNQASHRHSLHRVASMPSPC
jgi:hypothetical protein